MTCREVGEALLTGAHGDLPTAAQEHLASCENCRKVATVIVRDGDPYELPPSVLERVRGSIPASFGSVQPLAPEGLFVTLFLLIFAGIAIGGAELLGISGWPILSPAARVLISTVFLALSVLAAFATAQQMRPGGRTIRSGILFIAIFVAMETVFFLVFHDYSMGRFVRAGMVCLVAGLLCALPAGVLVWLLVRRGYILAPVSAGCAVGAMAGLSGVFALELHCPILTVPHAAIWHTAVLAVSVTLGATGGWIGSRAPTLD
jgi:hypothetical protein